MSNTYNTTAESRPLIIGGEFTIAENNHSGQTINLRQEFEQAPYRGDFQAFIDNDNTVSVYDTSFNDEIRAAELGSGGAVKLRWMEIKKDEKSDLCLSFPRFRVVSVPGAGNVAVTQNGYLYLQNKFSYISFQELLSVHLLPPGYLALLLSERVPMHLLTFSPQCL